MWVTTLNAWMESDQATGKRFVVLTVLKSGRKSGDSSAIYRMEAIPLETTRAGETYQLLDVSNQVWYVYGRNRPVMQALGFRRRRGKPTPEGKSGRKMHFIDSGGMFRGI